MRRVIRRGSRRCSAPAVLRDDSGASTFEWALLLAAIVLPATGILVMCFHILTDRYRVMASVNALPFP
jgi:Flp pilus assembly pilin Flp